MRAGLLGYFFLATALPSSALADRPVLIEAAFETGEVQPSSGHIDALWLMTLPDPQPAGTCDFFTPEGKGGFGPNSRTDFRVVQSEVWKKELITPRAGKYFARNVIDRTKCYPRDAPRSNFILTTPEQEYQWDEEIWLGFSVYLPTTWQHDNKFKKPHMAHLSGIGLLGSNATADSSHLAFRIHPAETSDINEWVLRLVPADAQRITDERDAYHSIASIGPDLGKWTDFVFRIRWNPFTERTNPARAGIAGAKDQWYEGNRGIFQIWKSVGEEDANGDRRMELVFSRVNQPLGLVPRADRGLRLFFDMYKYSWQTFDTDPKEPIFIGFDEIRYGRAADGIGFDDVVPRSGRFASAANSKRPPAAPLLLN